MPAELFPIPQCKTAYCKFYITSILCFFFGYLVFLVPEPFARSSSRLGGFSQSQGFCAPCRSLTLFVLYNIPRLSVCMCVRIWIWSSAIEVYGGSAEARYWQTAMLLTQSERWTML